MSSLPILAVSKTAYKTKASANRAAKKALIQHPTGSTFEAQDGEAGGFVWVIFGEAKVVETTQKEATPILRKSSMSGACKLVWDIAETGLAAGQKRKEIIAECVEQGIAYYTARTQYQKYTEAVRAAVIAKLG